MDFDLTRLGTREFEHLSQALLLKVIGPAVQVFGDGPDGGREATFNETVRLSGATDPWTGLSVVQAKFLARPGNTQQDMNWFLGRVRAELTQWANPDSRRSKLSRPKNILFVTNVVLTPASSGGIERFEQTVKAFADNLGLVHWEVWHYDKLCRLLEDAGDIRANFGGLITPGDVLAALHTMLVGTPPDLGETLRVHAIKDLLADQSVRLGQAGAADNQRLALSEVAIDLPCRLEAQGGVAARQVANTVAHLVEHGNAVWRQTISGSNLKAHVVLVGGPGQGKTTVGQLLAQTYRVAMLADSPGLGAQAQALIEATRDRLQDLGIPTPASKRWPVRVNLAEYGDAISGGEDLSLVRWIAQRVSARGDVDISAAQMSTWLTNWPSLVLLDGLDEVASLHARDHLMTQINDFLVESDASDRDVLIVATTRPQGYSGEFHAGTYAHLVLEPLEPRQVLEYAKRLADVRMADDRELRDQLVERVRLAVEGPITARLMRTPLQVTIMSLLLERRPRPPQERHGLFEAYYDVTYAREAAKPGYLARLLDDHRADVQAIHDEVGLRLQVQAEIDGDADSSMHSDALTDLVRRRLEREGHGEAEVEDLATKLKQAATDRLVLLVPKGESGVGFEVRSLQEFMAARALVAGPNQQVMERLRVVARSAHWRNTWLLAAGRIFTSFEHMRAAVIGLLRELDAESLLANVIPPGPELALELLDDDLAARSPQYRRQLLQHGLAVFERAPMPARGLSSILHDLGGDASLRALIVAALESAYEAGQDRRAIASKIAVELAAHTGELAARARQLCEVHAANESAEAYSGRQVSARTLVDSISETLRQVELSTESRAAVDGFLSDLGKVKPSGRNTIALPYLGEGVAAVIADESASDAVALALLDIPAADWAVVATLRTLLSVVSKRRAVGAELLAQMQLPV